MFHQATLLGSVAPAFDSEFTTATRTELSERSWVEFVPEWVHGADGIFDQVVANLSFQQRRNVAMYDRLVDEPRLTAWWTSSSATALPHDLLAPMGQALRGRYRRQFDSIGFNLYRSEQDSVAWHGDRHRHRVANPVVAIVSTGQRRPFQMRPVGGGASLTWNLGPGDLLVMGGACQHEWQHCVPKRRTPMGPRLSITYRHDASIRDRGPVQSAAGLRYTAATR